MRPLLAFYQNLVSKSWWAEPKHKKSAIFVSPLSTSTGHILESYESGREITEILKPILGFSSIYFYTFYF